LIDSDPGGPLTDDQPPKQPADDADGHPSSKPAWQRGEDLAARHLEELGYTIIARNWRSPHTRHEIDLIARDGKTIVFVEVKTARTEQFGDPLSWITPHKQEAGTTKKRISASTSSPSAPPTPTAIGRSTTYPMPFKCRTGACTHHCLDRKAEMTPLRGKTKNPGPSWPEVNDV
jgi:hypothetical protein